ncbi:hypothetical protein M0Q50_08245 [bacterium]|jgi:hypothetical protein|nr:hypothetical protein [bacterium]
MENIELKKHIEKQWSHCIPFKYNDYTTFMIYDPNLYRLKKLKSIQSIDIKIIRTKNTKILFEIDYYLNCIWIYTDIFTEISQQYNTSYSCIKKIIKDLLIKDMEIKIMGDKDIDDIDFEKLKYIEKLK